MRRREETIEHIRHQLAAVNAIINAAYWAFTRSVRSKPPVLVCPDAYVLRERLEVALHEKLQECSNVT